MPIIIALQVFFYSRPTLMIGQFKDVLLKPFKQTSSEEYGDAHFQILTKDYKDKWFSVD